MDLRVKEVQEWLGETFPSYFYYDENGENSGSFPIIADGKTGNSTVKALIMALQIILNLSPVDGAFGNGTLKACPTIGTSTNNVNLVKIVQGGLLCKGYNAGIFDGIYGNSTTSAVAKFKEDLGFKNSDGSIGGQILKSLLTTDPTLVTSDTNPMIRKVQQYLNNKYSDLYLTKLGYIPTSGVYERKTSKALIYAFQKIIGTTADGAIGTNTFSKMPSVAVGSTKTELNKILQCALICNDVNISSIDGIYSNKMANMICEFQKFMCLDLDTMATLGSVNRRTWGALLLSKGDPERSANALDCVHQVTKEEAIALYNAGYRYIGRYLTKVSGGLNKNLTDTEIDNLLTADIHIYPIFQETNSSIDAFTYEKGVKDGTKAFTQATTFRFPQGSIIYFAVDYDVTEAQAKNQVKDYFIGVKNALEQVNNKYGVGIYGSRNTCDIICNFELAIASFVSDMSTGYSGNLGFTIPKNWTFEQFTTTNFNGAGTTFAIDKNMASGKDKGVSVLENSMDDIWKLHLIDWAMVAAARVKAVNVMDIIPIIKELEDAYYSYKGVPGGNKSLAMDCCKAVIHYLLSYKYAEEGFLFMIPGDINFEHMVIANSDLQNKIEGYIREEAVINEDIESVKRYKLLKDPAGNLFELPHLAAVLSAYTSPTLISEYFLEKTWYGWAGDMATALNEMTDLYLHYPNSTPLDHARDRIGEMEPEIMPKKDSPYTVQFNYCDIYGDSDGVGLASVIGAYEEENNNGINTHIYYLSEAIQKYYGTGMYRNRHKYLLQDVGITTVDVNEVKSELVSIMSSDRYNLLRTEKAKIFNKNPDTNKIVMDGCCQSYAEWIVYELNK